jgi:hypothetical protein
MVCGRMRFSFGNRCCAMLLRLAAAEWQGWPRWLVDCTPEFTVDWEVIYTDLLAAGFALVDEHGGRVCRR